MLCAIWGDLRMFGSIGLAIVLVGGVMEWFDCFMSESASFYFLFFFQGFSFYFVFVELVSI